MIASWTSRALRCESWLSLLNCADHRELARFYARLLDGTLLWTHDKAAEDYRPPVWPGSSACTWTCMGSPDRPARVADVATRLINLVTGLRALGQTDAWPFHLGGANAGFGLTYDQLSSSEETTLRIASSSSLAFRTTAAGGNVHPRMTSFLV